MINKTEDSKLDKTKDFNEEHANYINKYNSYYNDIISKMCHEFYNPLTLINSTIQLMEVKNPSINEMEYWPLLKKDIKDCVELVNNFKEYRNCIELSFSSNNLLSLIETVINSFSPLAEQNNILLKLIITQDAISDFSSYPFDKVKLKQVFVNLIKNALESTKEKGYVHLVCKSNDSHLIIEIKDNGKGISDQAREKLFDPNFTTKETGTGLGLPISKAIIMLHNGNLDIESTDEETSFIITLPK